MSLVLTWVSPDFAAVVSDGRCATLDQDGNIVPVNEDGYKFFRLSPTIVLACTGNSFVREGLFSVAKAFADNGMIHPQDPVKEPDRPELLGELIAILPQMALYVFGLAEELIARIKGPIGPNVAVNLVGYDVVQGRMRQVLFLSEEG